MVTKLLVIVSQLIFDNINRFRGVLLHNLCCAKQAVVNSQRIALGVSLKLTYLGCEDIDECTGGATKCHKHAICTNFAVIITIITLEMRNSKGSHPFNFSKLSFQGNIFLSLQTWVYRRW